VRKHFHYHNTPHSQSVKKSKNSFETLQKKKKNSSISLPTANKTVKIKIGKNHSEEVAK